MVPNRLINFGADINARGPPRSHHHCTSAFPNPEMDSTSCSYYSSGVPKREFHGIAKTRRHYTKLQRVVISMLFDNLSTSVLISMLEISWVPLPLHKASRFGAIRRLYIYYSSRVPSTNAQESATRSLRHPLHEASEGWSPRRCSTTYQLRRRA